MNVEEIEQQIIQHGGQGWRDYSSPATAIDREHIMQLE